MILDGLNAAKADRYGALVGHDHAKATSLTREIIDVTHLCAEFADGLALSRQRFIAGGRPWPLG